MTCKLGYISEYIEGCDICKYGEGCERCINIFQTTNPFVWTGIILFFALTLCLILRLVFGRNLKEKDEI